MGFPVDTVIEVICRPSPQNIRVVYLVAERLSMAVEARDLRFDGWRHRAASHAWPVTELGQERR
jgi:hypothetical protein